MNGEATAITAAIAETPHLGRSWLTVLDAA
jgi:hypothetical protein